MSDEPAESPDDTDEGSGDRGTGTDRVSTDAAASGRADSPDQSPKPGEEPVSASEHSSEPTGERDQEGDGSSKGATVGDGDQADEGRTTQTLDFDQDVYPDFDAGTEADSSPAAADADTGDVGSEDGKPGTSPTDQPTQSAAQSNIPADVQSYDKFSKIDGSTYDRANEFLRDRTYITAREWAMARLCADFRTETGVEMTKIGENLPHLVPFMTDTYSPQAVNQARHAFEEKVRKSGATFLYGAMCDFFTAEELDDVMYEATEVAKFLLEVEGVELSVEDELEAEDRITEVMRNVRESSVELRHDEVTCPDCGHEFDASEE